METVLTTGQKFTRLVREQQRRTSQEEQERRVKEETEQVSKSGTVTDHFMSTHRWI